MSLHFVGFKGNEYISAIGIFGKPDFFHRVYDRRAIAEFCEGDTVIFANGRENKFTEYSFNDSEHF